MKRSLKFSLNKGNADKILALEKLYAEYIRTVNIFTTSLFNKQELSETYLKSLRSPLSCRYRQCAKRQAFKIFKSWCRNKKKGEKPVLRGSMILDYRFIEIQKSENSFDYWAKIATLNKGKPILIPFKSYDYANKYFNNWKLVNGGRLQKRDNGWFLLLTFEKETPKTKESGKVIGVDTGIKKLMVDSNGNQYGKEIEPLMNKIQRKQQGSKAFKRALKERDEYINKTVKEFPLNDKKVIVLENIKDIKKNTKKEKRLNKQFRSKFQRWTYSKLISRIQQLSEVDGVHCQMIAPAWTSQTCSRCGFVHKLNRNGEIFKCRNCDCTLDADWNASLNILNLGLTQQSMVAGNMKGNICL
ncbi:MAG: hypothetical protein DDT41_01229 [candidate division WS2 bacterium]|nr:hypothetical protein [Candidatus Psychracetigena formicireducens]